MEASKEEWVNSVKTLRRFNHYTSTILALVVVGVNPLFFGGLHISMVGDIKNLNFVFFKVVCFD